MKIDFAVVLKDLDGEPMKAKLKPGGPDVDLTLKDAVVTALCSPLESDRANTGREAFDRLELARRVNAGGTVEITPAEAGQIQDRLPKVYPTLIAGTAYALLNG